ncbi:MAG: hypothetical protein COA78_32940 [Blastopirellula sp.]|nr:MAG: hypothetical protein COA78_32940 [Blastopirellula sp.]
MSRDNSVGDIQSTSTYSRNEFMRRAAIKEGAYQTFVKNGLPVFRLAGRTFISGRAFQEWAEKNRPLIESVST